jgi:hypothetical protein
MPGKGRWRAAGRGKATLQVKIHEGEGGSRGGSVYIVSQPLRAAPGWTQNATPFRSPGRGSPTATPSRPPGRGSRNFIQMLRAGSPLRHPCSAVILRTSHLRCVVQSPTTMSPTPHLRCSSLTLARAPHLLARFRPPNPPRTPPSFPLSLPSSHPPILPSSHPPILPSSHPPVLSSFHPSILPSFHPPILPSSHPPKPSQPSHPTPLAPPQRYVCDQQIPVRPSY